VRWGVPVATLLFLIGVAFAWFILVPTAIAFLSTFQDDIFRAEWQSKKYIPFVTSIVFWIGISFETPLILFIMTKVGLVTPQFLLSQWRFAVIIIAILAAMILSCVPMFAGDGTDTFIPDEVPDLNPAWEIIPGHGIGPYKLDSPFSEVSADLGAPDTSFTGGTVIYRIYRDVGISFHDQNGVVVGMTSLSTRYAIKEGPRVGDRWADHLDWAEREGGENQGIKADTYKDFFGFPEIGVLIEVSKDGRILEINLEDVNVSGGTPVTADTTPIQPAADIIDIPFIIAGDYRSFDHIVEVESLEAGRRGDQAVFTLNYSTSKDVNLSFFDPPGGETLKVLVPVRADRQTVSFEVPVETLSRCRNITIIFFSPGSAYGALFLEFNSIRKLF
jgi:hypothetical protein